MPRSEFECPKCSLVFEVKKVGKIWECRCHHCKLYVRLKLPKIYDSTDAFCFVIDHIHGVRYRFVEVVTDSKVNYSALSKIEPGLAYTTQEVAAELSITEAQVDSMLWKAYQETNGLRRKKIKGKLYWMFLEVIGSERPKTI